MSSTLYMMVTLCMMQTPCTSDPAVSIQGSNYISGEARSFLSSSKTSSSREYCEAWLSQDNGAGQTKRFCVPYDVDERNEVNGVIVIVPACNHCETKDGRSPASTPGDSSTKDDKKASGK